MIIKYIYRPIRSIIFSVALFVVGLYVVCYTLFSIPAFTNAIKNRAALELSNLFGATVLIDQLEIYPFNEVKISGLEVIDPEGRECLYVETIGAGISIWKLVSTQKIILTFGEIIGLKAFISQETPDSKLNIDFIIQALSPKDDNKEKKAFDISLRNVVLRKSSANFRRPWLADKKLGEITLSNLFITNLAADISFPLISDKGIEVDLRRLSFNFQDLADIEKIALKGKFSQEEISVQNLTIETTGSRLFIPEISLKPEEGQDLNEKLNIGQNQVSIIDSYITPSDFSLLYPPLALLSDKLNLSMDVEGNLNSLNLEEFYFGRPDKFVISLMADIENLKDLKSCNGNLSDFRFWIGGDYLSKAPQLYDKIPPKLIPAIKDLGFLEIKGDFAAKMEQLALNATCDIESALFDIRFEGGVDKKNQKDYRAQGELIINNLDLQKFVPASRLSDLNANIVAEGSWNKQGPQGMMSLVVDDFNYKGKKYEGLSINISKEEEIINGDFLINNEIADMEARFDGDIEGEERDLRLDMDIRRLNLADFIDMKKYKGYEIAGSLNFDGFSPSPSDLKGDLKFSNLVFMSPDGSKNLRLKQLDINADLTDSISTIDLNSDWIDARAEGNIDLKELPVQVKNLISSVFPNLIAFEQDSHKQYVSDLEFDVSIKKNNSWTEFFNLPIKLLVPANISGTLSGSDNTGSLTFDLPYLQQGKDKLIYDTKIVSNIDGNTGTLNALIQTALPVKRGDLALNVNLFGQDNGLSTDIHWINTDNSDFKGHLVLDTKFLKNEFNSKPLILLTILPSVLQMGTAEWNISKTNISYTDKFLNIDNLRLWHDNQYVEVSGSASERYEDAVTINLEKIDVDYVFDMLQINYVTFGGVATGEIQGRALFSGNPVAETESLIIDKFSYNGALLGKCLASSRWNNEQKKIEIGADISDNEHQIVKAGGGIWLGRDSLSFNINADKVPVDFIQPFMAVFSSHVGGYATGGINLFGTFHDIDMTGKIFADSVAVQLDYTNTLYHGSDSIFLYPGRIEIPNFQLYDKFGNSALLTGELTHHYFHDPSFTFRLSDARNFLCYDTNADLNPDWYGTLFGTGSALLQGVPGFTDISADMTVGGNSTFTFVLSDTQYAKDYQFLTFSDRRKEANKPAVLTTQDIKDQLRQSMKQNEISISRFGIDIRASVTPQVLFTLIMDPAAGDKITARGKGAMQVKYESDNDEMMMYGKYEIEEGNYNFSLQDIILRDFKIKEGSYITFNGNPLAADLDISATYRVNTNLSDLDKSFSTDRDLNRTNVPVDAVLSVTGNMTSPDITFDIELPTLTQDVERKVKSIISTDDMMNRQIIYLLALNRFYTPEYMGASSNGGELAAVASSTISSQLSNILGQLTDKFSVAPSFRSDKGDFSDIEVDVALSSRLLNNRLLINGNFGYRDRSNSSTTFVGDFDVEYLLNKNGNLRLKAYNHFNDQNYYLREALTTQGLGIVYRRDFDKWFTFLKKKKKTKDEEPEEDNENEHKTE